MNHTCAIAEGALYCWGANTYGNLGLGSVGASTDQATPQRVGSFSDWERVAPGYSHTCALRRTQQLYCWGASAGVGTPEAPQAVPREMVDYAGWTNIASGQLSSCGLVGARLFCWGRDDFRLGILGLGADVLGDVREPVQVGTEIDWVALSIGNVGACGIRAGELYCWGRAYEIPSGTNVEQPTAVTPRTGWKSISMKEGVGCGLRAQGEIWCWGSNEFGQRGPERTNELTITRAESTGGWEQVQVGSDFICGVLEGRAYCWGHNEQGTLGAGSQLPAIVTTATKVGSSNGWSQVAAGEAFACGINQSQVYCWGNPYVPLYEMRPTLVDASTGWASVSAGGSIVGVRDGQLLWWFKDPAITGLSGAGDVSSTPAVIDSNLTGYSAATSKDAFVPHTCAIASPGRSLYCYGANNAQGQLGTGDTERRSAPTRIGTSNTWDKVAVGGLSSCGIDARNLYCWGENRFGQLGLGAALINVNQTEPQRVGAETGWEDISIGGVQSCGVRAGSLYCWGGLNASVTEPIAISTENDWISVSVSELHACALRGTRDIYCWGNNATGALGLGDAALNTIVSVPTRIQSTADWMRVSTSPTSSCGLQSDGTLWCWGGNELGQLGLGAAWSNKPVEVQLR